MTSRTKPKTCRRASIVLASVKEETMATVTIRNLPDSVVQRIKQIASNKGHSMEQEVRELLENQYAEKAAILDEIRQSWKTLPVTTEEEVNAWKEEGRP